MFGFKQKPKKTSIPSLPVGKSKAVTISDSHITFVSDGTPEIVTSDAPFPHLFSFLPYFEVVIEFIHPKGCVAVGLTLSSFQEKHLPGWIHSSYGYHSDDGKVFGAQDHADGKPFHSSFGKGDVVGCGLNHKNEVFFTLNGKFIKTAFSNVPKDEWYPTVGVDYDAKVTVNFGTSPFLLSDPWNYIFNTEKTPDTYVIGQSASFDNIPNDIMSIILEYATEPPNEKKANHLQYLKNVSNLSKVSKKFYTLLVGSQSKTIQPNMSSVNKIWKELTLARWVFVSESNVNNWYKFYKRRHVQTKDKTNPLTVDNCMEWEFKCPVSIQSFSRTPNPKVDYCSQCKKNVYLSSDIEELSKNVQQGHCVVYDVGGKEGRARAPPRTMLRGKIQVRPTPTRTD